MITNLNVNEYYFHSIIHGVDNSIQVIKNIMDCGAIKSPKSLGVPMRLGCHHEDDVCLSHVTSGDIPMYTYSCFELYVSRLISFVIDPAISRKYHILKPDVVSTGEMFRMDGQHITNLYDEYRIQNDIPLEYIRGICVPVQRLIEDPLTFVPFISEEVLLAYYNNELDGIFRKFVLDKQNNDKARQDRCVLLDQCIQRLQTIMAAYHTEIPIYHYDEAEPRKLILR